MFVSVWRRRRRDEEGASALLVLMVFPVLVAALGLVVESGGLTLTRNQVQWTADQAARVAGQRIDPLVAQTSGAPSQTDLAAASAAAERIWSAVGMTGKIEVVDGQVVATVTGRYDARILPLSQDCTAHSVARAAYGVGAESERSQNRP